LDGVMVLVVYRMAFIGFIYHYINMVVFQAGLQY